MPEPTDKPDEREREWKPVPDPTTLTTEALRREIGALREQFVLRLDGVVGMFTARFDGMDKAQELFQHNLGHVPSETDKAITQLQKLHDERFGSFEHRVQELARLQEEKFTSIATQFRERDTRVEQTAHDTKVAVDAALLAQQAASDKQAEAFAASIQKSETAFGKQIDAMGALINSSKQASDDKFEDLKERLTRIEGAAVGQLSNRVEQREAGGSNMMIVMAVIAAVAVIVSVVAAVMAARGH